MQARRILFLVATIFIAIIGLNGCRDQSSDLNLSEQANSPKKQQDQVKLSPLAQLAPMDVPVDEFSGAYSVCLRSNDYRLWSQRIKSYKNKDVHALFEEYGHPKSASSVSGFLTQSLTEAMSPISFGIGLAARANKILKDLASGSNSQVARNPLCGNWCGPGHPILSGQIENLDIPATDPVDMVCKFHDICYIKFGFQNCACDQMLLNMIAHDRDFTTINPAEFAMITYFQSSTCSKGCKRFGNIRVCGQSTF